MSTPSQVASWRQTLTELGPRQREVLDTLTAAYPRGMSAWQLADKLGRLVHAVRPRIVELRERGLVRAIGERFEPLTQRHEAVWTVIGPPEPSGQLRLI